MPADLSTGLTYKPHYLDVGIIVEGKEVNGALVPYEQLTAEQIEIDDFGELTATVAIRQLIDWSQDDKSLNKPDRNHVLAAVEQAESEFDAYLANRFRIPIRTTSGHVPREAKSKTQVLFRHYLASRRGYTTPSIQASYEDAVRFLTQAARGLISIPDLVIGEDGVEKEIQQRSSARVGRVYRGDRDNDFPTESQRFDHWGSSLDY